MRTKVVLLEFNEICPPLLDRWLAQGRLPNFKRLFDTSDVFVSVADEADPANLEPWIQWYSIHTGLPYAEHRVFHLTDGPRAAHTDLWRIVQEAGRSAMNCSSMNAKGFSGQGAFFLPDPWCASEASWPPEIGIFAKVVSTAVREYSNARIPLALRDYAAFLKFLVGHGLSPATVCAILSQLAAEKLAPVDVAWRRAYLLDRLQYDVFAHYYRRLRPDFATFFVNSTAHLQHAYWRHLDPEPFAIKPSAAELKAYGGAVFEGYAAMDRLIARFLSLVGGDAIVILCSALSQQPFLKWENKGGQHFYRLHDVGSLLRRLDAAPQRVEPVMTHQYLVRYASAEAAAVARHRLQAVTLGDRGVFGVSEAPDNSLEFGCQIFNSVTGEEELTGIAGSNAPVRFDALLYRIDAVKSGCHHPEGVLWIHTGRHVRHTDKVSILDIAPTICNILNLAPAIIARVGFHGTDLLEPRIP